MLYRLPLSAAFGIAVLTLAPASGAAQAAVDLATTPRQVYDDFDRDGGAANRKYVGRTVQVRGTADVIERSSFANYSGIHFYADAPRVSVRCHFDDAELPKLDAVVKGSVVTVVGSEVEQTGPYTIRLKHCRVVPQASAPAARESAAPTTLPVNPPAGEYAVYQWNGPGGFAFQYRFTLAGPTRYRVRDDEWGTYAYDASTKRLRFTSGPLRGFGGLYYTTGRNANGPTIALNATGAVTDLEGRANGAYQYAFFRPGGVR